MAKARPWWERKQAVDVAEAARAAGFTVSVRLGGLLEITETGGTKPVMDARFSFNSGAFIVATARAADGSPTAFRKNTGPYTPREVVDSIVEWYRRDRPPASAATLMQDAMIRRSGLVPSIPPTREHEELAVVIPITSRRNS